MRFARSEADQSYTIISGFVNITATGRFCSNLPSRIAVSASFLRPHHPLHHRPLRADRDVVGEIDDVPIEQADAAARERPGRWAKNRQGAARLSRGYCKKTKANTAKTNIPATTTYVTRSAMLIV